MWKVIGIFTDILLIIMWSFCTVTNLQAGSNIAGILDLLCVILWAFMMGADVANVVNEMRD